MTSHLTNTPTAATMAAEYQRLWADNPLDDAEIERLNTAAEVLEDLLNNFTPEDPIILEALYLINALRGFKVEEL